MSSEGMLKIVAEHLGQDGWHISYQDSNGVFTYPAEQRLEFVHKKTYLALQAELKEMKCRFEHCSSGIMNTWVPYKKRVEQQLTEAKRQIEDYREALELISDIDAAANPGPAHVSIFSIAQETLNKWSGK